MGFTQAPNERCYTIKQTKSQLTYDVIARVPSVSVVTIAREEWVMCSWVTGPVLPTWLCVTHVVCESKYSKEGVLKQLMFLFINNEMLMQP